MASLIGIGRVAEHSGLPLSNGAKCIEVGLDHFEGNTTIAAQQQNRSLSFRLSRVVHIGLIVIAIINSSLRNTLVGLFLARAAVCLSVVIAISAWPTRRNDAPVLPMHEHATLASPAVYLLHVSNAPAIFAVLILIASAHSRRKGLDNHLTTVDMDHPVGSLALSKNPFGVEAEMARSAEAASRRLVQLSREKHIGTSNVDRSDLPERVDQANTPQRPSRGSYLDAVPDSPLRSIEERVIRTKTVDQSTGDLKRGERESVESPSTSTDLENVPPSDGQDSKGYRSGQSNRIEQSYTVAVAEVPNSRQQAEEADKGPSGTK